MEAANAQNWAVEPQEKKKTINNAAYLLGNATNNLCVLD
jgi:hypothetical protein